MNKNKYQAEADRIAREHLYDRADFVGEWESYTVYISSMDGDEVHIIGYPYFFLFDAAGKCRVVMMQPGVEKEWYSLMDMASRLFDADEIQRLPSDFGPKNINLNLIERIIKDKRE